MIDLTQLPEDLKDVILRHAAAFSLACDALEDLSAEPARFEALGKHSSIEWGAAIAAAARERIEALSPQEKDELLGLAMSSEITAGAIRVVNMRKPDSCDGQNS